MTGYFSNSLIDCIENARPPLAAEIEHLAARIYDDICAATRNVRMPLSQTWSQTDLRILADAALRGAHGLMPSG